MQYQSTWVGNKAKNMVCNKPVALYETYPAVRMQIVFCLFLVASHVDDYIKRLKLAWQVVNYTRKKIFKKKETDEKSFEYF